MDLKELLELVEHERSSYFQFIMCNHCDDDSEIKLDEDQAHHVLYAFVERLNTALAEATEQELQRNRDGHRGGDDGYDWGEEPKWEGTLCSECGGAETDLDEINSDIHICQCDDLSRRSW